MQLDQWHRRQKLPYLNGLNMSLEIFEYQHPRFRAARHGGRHL